MVDPPPDPQPSARPNDDSLPALGKPAAPTTTITVGVDVGQSTGGTITGLSIGQLHGNPQIILPPAPRTLAQRNRQTMLNKVQHIWIDGLLQHSLYQEVLIRLGVSEHPAAVLRPLDMYVWQADQAEQPLPSNTRILDVYDRSNGALLILGAPGAGKTTLLLELTQDLLQRAREDESHPMPVVFPLASWASRQLPLAEWLVDELNKRYEVSPKIGQSWVDTDTILPLLDGLDEVAGEHQAACVEAINAYRRDHGLLPVVVTSRRADYDELSVKLRLQSAIGVESLTREQVRHYVRQVGFRITPNDDSPLWELLETPLFLHVATLTYAGRDGTIVPSNAPADEQREHLFAAYVDRMFERKRITTRYTEQQAKLWLAWLAWQLQHHSQPTLYLEQLQPDWLPDRKACWQYTILDRVGGGLVVGLGSGLLAGLEGGLEGGLLGGLLFGLVGGLILGLFGGNRDRVTPISRGIAQVMYAAFLGWVVVALAFGLAGGLVGGLVGGLEGRLAPGLVVGLCGALVGVLVGKPGVYPRNIVVVGVLRWSLARAWRASISGPVIGLVFAPVIGLEGGLIIGLESGLLFGLLGGLTSSEISEKVRPNQGIWRSIQGGLLTGLSGLLFGLLFGLASGLGYGVKSGLLIGLVVGVCCALAYGGYAFLSHFTLRVVLWRRGAMPLRYVRFLEEAVDRILLRRVGGDYSFVHRLLLEWFAKQYSGPETHQDKHSSQ